ncbi:MAG TPA: hypothetical protein VFI69_03695 [Candidatus Limnocylindrales bacterium]|nr:hypothetical protein [Candidatus Limnocylindrales bacterium]
MTRDILLIGTPKGAFFLERDGRAEAWDLRGPLCEGWPIHDLIVEPASGAILAAGGSPWYGPAVWRSDDLGATWTHSSKGLTYDSPADAAGDATATETAADDASTGDGPPDRSIKTVWSLAVAPDGAILAGVEPAGLFRSEDGGSSWTQVEGLTNHPTRPTWQPGAGGLILHTIVPHPTDAARTWVGISAVGVFETRDRGATWEPRNRGVRADFMPDPHPVTGQCVHKLAMAAGEPETLYQQNHCGVYRSTDGGASWTDLSAGVPSEFGFPLVTHPRDPSTFWVIPLNGADRGRFVPDASVAVWRTRDRGDTWTRGAAGLPQHDAYLSVLREAMARDDHDPVGITFGTKTGQLWHSADEGDSWRLLTANLPEIWAVETVTVAD